MAKNTRVALVNIIEDKNVYPLNLIYIATYLREIGGFNNIRVIDINWEDPIAEIEKYQPDIVGVSSLTATYNSAVKIAEKIKEVTDATIIIGGVHISALPESMSPYFDVAVIGEGEETMLELVNAFEENGSLVKSVLRGIKGVSFLDNRGLVTTEKREHIVDLDSIPVPDVSFLHTEHYFKKKDRHTFKGKVGKEANILTSRGCPYRCVFCHSPIFWQNVRHFSVQRVLEEIKMLGERYGIDCIQIYDDLFTIRKSRIRELTKLLREHGILGKVSFACQSRANIIDDELCEMLNELGVVTISFGFESGSDRVLSYLKRDTVTVEQNKKAVKLCKNYGFNVYGSLILGSPGEKVEDMKKTLEFIDFLKENGADGIDVFVASPFPSTELWCYGEEHGRITEALNFDSIDFYDPEHPLLLDEDVDIKEFKEIYGAAIEKISTFTHKRSIINVLRYPKESRVKIVEKAILNPKELLKRRFF